MAMGYLKQMSKLWMACFDKVNFYMVQSLKQMELIMKDHYKICIKVGKEFYENLTADNNIKDFLGMIFMMVQEFSKQGNNITKASLNKDYITVLEY
jgi:hypothetical protein